MSVINQRDSGRSVNREGAPVSNKRQCMQCGFYKNDALFTMNANGQLICPDCAGPRNRAVLRQTEGAESDTSGA